MFSITWRKLLLAFLVSAFVLQTWLVYTDDIGRSGANAEPLNALALEGRGIWHEKNCQTCHQIYGFGGFLGPDLTNAAKRVTRQRLDEVLTKGTGQMPAFDLSPKQIDAIAAWLEALDKTGVGQARAVSTASDPAAMFHEFMGAGKLPSDAARGAQIYTGRCSACHAMLRDSVMGTAKVPDLSTVFTRLKREDAAKVITEGRVGTLMTGQGLSAEQLSDVLAFLEWLGANRQLVADKLGSGAGGLPWWEFK